MSMSTDTDGEPVAAPSKTQIKQAMHELQALGATLLELPDAQLDEIEMEDSLRTALRTMRTLRSREARRRQMQYVGKLLRVAEVEPLRRAIADYRAGRNQAAQAFQEIEDWRERLLADDAELNAWSEACPATDLPRLRVLIRNARREQASMPDRSGDGGAAGKGRCYRELFRRLRAEMEASGSLSGLG